ncbi:MAG: type II secretion system F family protein [Eubacteriales bacterium]
MDVEKFAENRPNYSQYRLSRKEALNYYIKSGIALFAVGFIFYGNLIIPLFLASLAVPLRKFYEADRLKRMVEKLRYSFRDLLYALDASISSGRQMAEALIEAQSSLCLIYDESEPIMRELSIMANAINESRENEEELLKDFAYRSKVPEIISFAETYCICRSTGANVKQVISNTTQILVDRLNVSREIQTLTAQKRVEGKIISLMPILIIVLLNFVSPGYLDKLYHTGAGMIIMTIALGITAIAYYVLGRIMDIEI